MKFYWFLQVPLRRCEVLSGSMSFYGFLWKFPSLLFFSFHFFFLPQVPILALPSVFPHQIISMCDIHGELLGDCPQSKLDYIWREISWWGKNIRLGFGFSHLWTTFFPQFWYCPDFCYWFPLGIGAENNFGICVSYPDNVYLVKRGVE